MLKALRSAFTDLKDLISAAVRCAVYIPLYRLLVLPLLKRDVSLPAWLVGTTLHGSRKARQDFEEVSAYWRMMLGFSD